MKLILYSAPDCHLCDLAKAVINNVAQSQVFSSPAAGQGLIIEVVNVRQGIDLKRRYGIRIPVVALSLDGEAELGWPFDEDVFAQWYLENNGV